MCVIRSEQQSKQQEWPVQRHWDLNRQHVGSEEIVKCLVGHVKEPELDLEDFQQGGHLIKMCVFKKISLVVGGV